MKTKQKNGYSITGLLQAFSIDVVIGTLAMGMFAVKWCNVSLPVAWWFILGLSVWIIYTSDHLIDSLKKKQKATIYRHRLHHLLKNYLRILTFVLMAITILLSILYLDKKTILAGIGLGVLVIIYLLSITVANRKNSYFFKELFIAFIYVTGIWLMPIVHCHTNTTFSTIGMLLLFILLAISEGVIISLYERSLDISDSFQSFSTHFGRMKTKKFVLVLLIVALTGSLTLLVFFPEKIHAMGFLISAVMSVILLLLLYFPTFFTKRNAYRLVGELVFWLPGILWFISS